jgi:putative transposase
VSFCTSARPLPQRFQWVLRSFLQSPGLPFADVLPEEDIQAVFDEEGVAFAQQDSEVYTPALTLWAFLSQVLFKEEQRSCLAAVSRVVVLMAVLGREVSDNTGAYCRARAKLPEVVLRRLTQDLARRSEQQVPSAWLWHGRHVKLVDGTTVSMPDTRANQQAYPQAPTQLPGLGFPIARMVVLMSLATAMVCGMELGPYAGKETGESALLRKLFGQLDSQDIVLADSYYCSYFLIVLLGELALDFVVRLHHRRRADFRLGQRLGQRDHLVQWLRPAKPEWMDQATYDRMPRSIGVRELLVQVKTPGFRVESFVVVTTLTDAEQFPRAEVAQLYHQRWRVELDLRALKITLGMDVLRCQSPEMVRREIWTCLLAYNLMRQTMLTAAQQAGVLPREMSFAAALQKIAAGWLVVLLVDEAAAQRVIEAHRNALADHRVGDRPDRVEPRAIKRRPKPHKLLTQPRAEARAALLSGTAA